MQTDKQLANLERGRIYRWRKGESGNYRGRPGRLSNRLPDGRTVKQALVEAAGIGDVVGVLSIVRQALKTRHARFIDCPDCSSRMPARSLGAHLKRECPMRPLSERDQRALWSGSRGAQARAGAAR